MAKEITQPIYHTHISSNHRWLRLNLREVWQYRDLIWLFTKRNFVVSYKQTVLGPLWIFINPILSSLVYTFVFGGVAGMSTDGLPQILFYLASNAIWTFFSSSIGDNAATFRGNAAVFGKVYFPRLTTPISNVLSSAIRFGVQMLLVLVFLLYYVVMGEVQPHWEAWLLIPLCLVNLALLGMGVGIIVSSLTTKYRDLTVFIHFGIQLWMYATPVVYPLSQLGEGTIKNIIMLNPATSVVEVFRYAVLGQGTIIPRNIVISWILSIIVSFIGIIIFNKVERTFMDTV